MSAGGLMTSLDRKTGRQHWSLDLLANTADAVRACGYAASPLASTTSSSQLLAAQAGASSP